MTGGRGLGQYSLETSEVKKIGNSTENLLGITFDSILNKLYWSSDNGTTYGANKDGTELETVLNTTKCKSVFIIQVSSKEFILLIIRAVVWISDGYLWGLTFDWIGRNIYVSNLGGLHPHFFNHVYIKLFHTP